MNNEAVFKLDSRIIKGLMRKTIADMVNEWPAGEGPVLLVKKLRTSVFPLTSKQIFAVLEAIESTCPLCWNTDISGDQQCTCEREL